MWHKILVLVETDDRDVDAPTAQAVANEIETHLEELNNRGVHMVSATVTKAGAHDQK